MNTASSDHQAAVIRTLRQRAAEMGVPTWRVGVDGMLFDEPDQKSLVGLFLKSRMIRNAVSSAVSGWNAQDEPEIVGSFDGCRLLPLPITTRRKRTGYLVGMALSMDAVRGATFDAVCAASQTDVQATRTAVEPWCCFDAESASRCWHALKWMFHDLGKGAEDTGVIESFTHQLTDSYETIDFLYALGRSMSDLEHPADLLRSACSRLQLAMSFKWLGVILPPESTVLGVVGERSMWTGRPPENRGDLDERLSGLLGDHADETRAFAASLTLDAGTRPVPLVIQPVMHRNAPAAYLVAGEKLGSDTQMSSYDTRLLETAAAFVSSYLDNACLLERQREMFFGLLRALTATIDAKDPYTRGHSERVAMLARDLAIASGMSEDEARRVHICGLLHDVGKIGVPERVLCKPGRLTDEEFELIKRHPEIGHRILRDIPGLEDVLEGVLYHHERWDGRGYPAGLEAADIPHIARILALADAFDAMSSNRAYRSARSRDEILREIRACSGRQFDAELAELFLSLDFDEYDAVVRQHATQKPYIDEDTDRAAA